MTVECFFNKYADIWSFCSYMLIIDTFSFSTNMFSLDIEQFGFRYQAFLGYSARFFVKTRMTREDAFPFMQTTNIEKYG